MMRILIISRTPWNNSNSFGNTFSNLFGGMLEVEIYNICCQTGSTDNSIVAKTLQMSESSVVNSLKGRPVAITESYRETVESVERMQVAGKKSRSPLMFMARDMIWRVGAHRWKAAVRRFVKEVNPDIIYLPIYGSWYMCDIDGYVIKKSKVPVVGHITHDSYGYASNEQAVNLARLYRMVLRKKLKALIRECSYIEVFADNMKKEYERLFNIPCHVIGKGLLPEDVCKPQIRQERGEVHFVYTGGIGGERYSVLMALAKAFSCQSDKKCYLDIYSATPLTDTMKAEMDSVDSIVFHGAVNGSEVRKIQLDADYLVHVEGFSKESISATRMSFSTKIPDYLSTGNVMLAIGPADINSIQVLQSRGIAVVVDNLDNLTPTIFRLLNGEIDTSAIQERAYTYIITERNKSVIQAGMLDRLKKLV